MRPQFTKHSKLVRRMSKVAVLDALNTPEARKARKEMNVHSYGKTRMNLTGFFGKQRVKGKIKRQRKVKLSSVEKANFNFR